MKEKKTENRWKQIKIAIERKQRERKKRGIKKASERKLKKKEIEKDNK